MVNGRELGREHAGGAVWRVGDAHPDAHLARLGREPRDQRPALQELAARADRQLLGEAGDHPERVLHLPAVRRLRNDDPVEGPDGVEVQLFCKRRQVFEFLDSGLLAEVGQVERELLG